VVEQQFDAAADDHTQANGDENHSGARQAIDRKGSE
jgi:hypothetical protein